MSEKNSFIFYRSFYDALKTLSTSERAILYEAIAEYAFNQNEIEMPAICKGMFCLIKPQLEANHKKFIDGKKGGKHGKKGGRPKTPVGIKEETPKGLFSETPNVNDNVNVNVNVNDKDIIPDFINAEIFNEYVLMRKKIKKPLTEKAKLMAINALTKFYNEGKDPNKILEASIFNNWTGLYANDTRNNSQYGGKGNNTGKLSVTDAVRAVDEAIARGEI